MCNIKYKIPFVNESTITCLEIWDLIYGAISLPAMPSDNMMLENLNGSSAIRTEYTGHKTKGKHSRHDMWDPH